MSSSSKSWMLWAQPSAGWKTEIKQACRKARLCAFLRTGKEGHKLKKRFCAMLVLLALMLTFVPIRAQATEYTTVSQAAVTLREAMVARQETVTVYVTVPIAEVETAYEDIFKQALQHTSDPVQGDYLQWHFAGYTVESQPVEHETTCDLSLTYELQYYTTADQEAQVTAAVNDVLQQLDLYDATEYQKIKGIYDYICDNVTYDHENLSDSSYMLKYTAYAAIVNGTAVCQGYASLFYRMALALGLDCRVISGVSQGEDHGWNIVRLNGYYYNLDATWDSERGAGQAYHYFLRGSRNFGEHTRHEQYDTPDFNIAFPMSAVDYAYDGEVTENGFTFSISNGEAMLQRYTGEDADVVIPGTVNDMPVTAISGRAFENNTNLRSVTIPASVQAIEDGYLDGWSESHSAFYRCTNLEEVWFEEGSQLSYIGISAFECCSKLGSITLPDTLQTVGESAFSGCERLQSLELPDGLVTLGQNVISGSGIKTLTIPASCIEVSFSQGASMLEEFIVAEGNPVYCAHEGVLYALDNSVKNGEWTLYCYPAAKQAQQYRVADFASSVCSDSFADATQLQTLYIGDCWGYSLNGDHIGRIRCRIIPDDTNPYYRAHTDMLLSKDGTVLEQLPSSVTGTVTIPDGVTTIAAYACEHGSYTQIILPETVRSIKGAAFWYTPTLESIDLPTRLDELGTSAFYGCGALQTVTIPEGITKISVNAFSDCRSLKQVTLPSTLLELEYGCFAGTGLENIGIPEGVQTIGMNAFMNCPDLECVMLPSTLTKIGYGAFGYSSRITDVHYAGSQQQWEMITVEGENEPLTGATLHYDEGQTVDPGVDPTDPTQPSDPTQPDDPTEPSEPTQPIEPTQPSQPATEPSDPATEPSAPSTVPVTDPTDPVIEDPLEPEVPTMLIAAILGGAAVLCIIAMAVIHGRKKR